MSTQLDYTKYKDEEGEPVARRAEPRPGALPREHDDDETGSPSAQIASARARASRSTGKKAEKAKESTLASAVTPEPTATSRAMLNDLKHAAQVEERAYEQNLADIRAMLRPTIKAAEKIIEEVLAWKRQHGEWMEAVRDLDHVELLTICGGNKNQAATDRFHRITKHIEEAFSLMHNVPISLGSDIELARTLDPQRFNMRRSIGASDVGQPVTKGEVVIGVRDLQRRVNYAAGTRQRLEELRAMLEVSVMELHQRVEAARAAQPTTRSTIIDPREIDRRNDMRPTPLVGHAVNNDDGGSDWNPLDYTPRRG